MIGEVSPPLVAATTSDRSSLIVLSYTRRKKNSNKLMKCRLHLLAAAVATIYELHQTTHTGEPDGPTANSETPHLGRAPIYLRNLHQVVKVTGACYRSDVAGADGFPARRACH